LTVLPAAGISNPEIRELPSHPIGNGAGSGHQSHLRFSLDPGIDSRFVPAGAFEVLEVLAQGGLVELSQKRNGDSGIVLTDFVDQLTFAHGGHTFLKSLPPAGKGRTADNSELQEKSEISGTLLESD
jgi:hypothetical protein